jgi:Holliday junction resolvasome RuvABC endonuclease subunit
MTSTTAHRVLAIDPGMQYLGIAVLDGEDLLWYGVKTYPDRKSLPQMRISVKQDLAKLLEKYAPDVLVVEEPFYAQSTLSNNLKRLTADIKTWGRWKGLKVFSYVPPVVKAFFCRDQRTKQSLAEAMVERYPFLSKYLTILPWRRRYWFHVFDAVGLGLMCQHKLARRKISL